jgi:hypothetical protein
MGGIFYVTASIVFPGLPNRQSSSTTRFLYYLVWTLGPLVYICNSIIDILWAWRVKVRRKKRKLRKELMQAFKEDLKADTKSSEQEKKMKKRKFFSRLQPKKLFKRIRKHVGHRRDLSAAITFGIAASFALASVAASHIRASIHIINRFHSLSVHFYIISAIFALCGKRSKTPTGACWLDISILSNADRLENMGDALFGIGSLVDVLVCDTHFDEGVESWPVISAILWLCDALLYLRADFCTLYSSDRKEYDTGGGMTDEDSTHFSVVSSASSFSTATFSSSSGSSSALSYLSIPHGMIPGPIESLLC